MTQLAAQPIDEQRLHSVLKALLMSATAVGFFAIVEGIVLLPDWWRRVSPPPSVAIHSCSVRADGLAAISHLRVFCGGDHTGIKPLIAWHDFSENRPVGRTLHANTAAPTCATVSWPSDLLLFACEDGRIYTTDLRLPNARPEPLGRQTDGFASQIACAPSGRFLVTFGFRSLYVWDVANRKLQWRWKNTGVRCFAILPDSHSMICGLHDGRLAEVCLETGRVRPVSSASGEALFCVSICPGGRRAALLGAKGLVLYDLAEQKPLWSRPHPAEHCLAFSPDGKLLVSTVGDHEQGALLVWNTGSGDRLAMLDGHASDVSGVAFQNNRSVYSWSLDGSIRLWDLESRQLIRTITPLPPEPLDEPQPLGPLL